ncbi:phage tail protein [Hymenobacter sp. GOD-10R]|uniref:phage tail protein n=1 Tax=Hymenobacter sp. GOD-10R TaxID=3093922 RepID=UPI002D76D423|nr:tail fiber protein [Hymenobacter sp. GOD-10R]WRQ31126.1 tail fiber protein [Hymenobacter sp. GOD-10R]
MRLLATSSGFANLPAAAASHPTNQERRSWLKRLGAAIGLGMLGGPALASSHKAAFDTNGAEPYLGEIMLFAGNFQVRGYAFCNGQLLSIVQNQALFSILGTTYGGNGTTTFALPDLRGRFPMHFGQGPGLPNYNLGEVAGTPSVTLGAQQMPAHNHTLNISSAAATSNSPAGNVLAVPNGLASGSEENVAVKAYAAASNGTANNNSIGTAGSSQPVGVMNPYLTLNFQIAVQGLYPSRD